jgi:hypothetical protein
MYTRTILPKAETLIVSGLPVAGTFADAFNEVNLLDIKRPFSLPLPKFIRNLRVKEWESFVIQNNEIYLEAFLANMKFYSFAELFFYDKVTSEKLRFFKVIPFSTLLKLPNNLYSASVESRHKGFVFHIQTWLKAKLIEINIDLKFKKSSKKPAFTCKLQYYIDSEFDHPLVASLLFSETRNMYTYKNLAPVRGNIIFGDKNITLDSNKTMGLFRDCKGFYPYRMRAVWSAAFGYDKETGFYGFSLGENQTKESNKDNENALWVNGELTPLPQVRITSGNPGESDAVIQDLEGMVDLTFKAKEDVTASFNLYLTRSEYDTPIGVYNGVLVDKNGNKIRVRNLWGTVEKLYLRV